MVLDYTHRNFDDPVFQDLAIALGKVALAWNDFHITLSGVFGATSRFNNQLIPAAMWFSQKSDRAQRDMLQALCDSTAIGNPLFGNPRGELDWVLCQARKIEDLRNDFLHAPFAKSGDMIFPFLPYLSSRSKKLTDKDVLKLARWFFETTITLRDYTEEIVLAIQDDKHTLPKRPSLPNRGQTKTK